MPLKITREAMFFVMRLRGRAAYQHHMNKRLIQRSCEISKSVDPFPVAQSLRQC